MDGPDPQTWFEILKFWGPGAVFGGGVVWILGKFFAKLYELTEKVATRWVDVQETFAKSVAATAEECTIGTRETHKLIQQNREENREEHREILGELRRKQ